jgi:hypothetical protein
MKTIAQQLNIKEFPFEIKDKNNNKLYFENSYGYWIKREFDKNNNEVYYENSDGFWVKREFDENNNQLYVENSNGFWCKCEYDKNNNEIYYEDSDDYWVKREYDENNILYAEDSYVKIIDNRSKKCTDKVVTIDGVDYELKEIKK